MTEERAARAQAAKAGKAEADEAEKGDERVAAQIHDFVGVLVKCARAAQIYVPTSPVLRNFMDDLSRRLDALWESLKTLVLNVEELSISWQGRPVYQAEETPDNLAFQFFKDGIRRITILPGAEVDEIREFVNVIRHARQAGEQAEDLLTLLWYRDFSFIRYEYVDVLPSETRGPEAAAQAPEAPGHGLAFGVAGAPGREEGVAAQGAGALLPNIPGLELTSAMATPVLREDFQPTLYFLDETDVAYLQREVRLEWDRDLRRDVVHGLLDQLEVGEEEFAPEALESLKGMLPRLLATGDFASAGTALSELEAIAAKRPELRDAVDRFLEEASEPDVLSELVRTLEDGSVNPAGEGLSQFLGALRPSAIPILMRAVADVQRHEARVQLVEALERLAAAHHDRIVKLLTSPDPAVVIEAVRMVGRLGIADAVPQLGALLEREEGEVRVAAVETLSALRSSGSGGALLRALADPERGVRLAAARGLAALAYRPGTEQLEKWVTARSLHKRDLTEQLAYFEAYARAAGDRAVPRLERLLFKRRWWGARQPPAIRACAARALGVIESEAAAAVLARAENDRDPMVRGAVQAARRGRKGA